MLAMRSMLIESSRLTRTISYHDYILITLEAVHFLQQLINRHATARAFKGAASSFATYRVNFVEKNIHGEFSRASFNFCVIFSIFTTIRDIDLTSKSLFTRFAPTSTNISSNCARKGPPASPAIDFAISVLPVPVPVRF